MNRSVKTVVLGNKSPGVVVTHSFFQSKRHPFFKVYGALFPRFAVGRRVVSPAFVFSFNFRSGRLRAKFPFLARHP